MNSRPQERKSVDIQDIQKRSLQIARKLQLPAVRERIPGDLRKRFYESLQGARERAEALEPNELYHQLESIARTVNPRSKRELHTSLILIDLAYIIPANRLAQHDVYRIIGQFYAACEEESYRWRIRDRLIDAQWSGIPSVRRLAASIRQYEAVTSEEAKALLDEDCPSEIRRGIADRVLYHRQSHFEVLLKYLIRRTQDRRLKTAHLGAEEAQEFKNAGAMFKHLAGFPQKTTIEPLYKAYSQHHSDNDVRGRLLEALREYREYAITAAAHICTDAAYNVSLKSQALDLLAYLILWSQEQAVEKYIEALDILPGEMMEIYCGHLERHLGKMSSFDADLRILERLEDFGGALRKRPEPRLQELGNFLLNLRYNSQIDEPMLERLARGEATQEEEMKIARGAIRAVPFIEKAITTKSRPAADRRRLLGFLGSKVKGLEKRSNVSVALWDLFENDPEIDVDALQVLIRILGKTQIELPIPKERVRSVLDNRLRSENKDEVLRKKLLEAWKLILRDIPNPHVGLATKDEMAADQ